ncbi:prolipoprotein diacylglyceryl transferase [Paenibacillus sp. URB8-2]|uniref:prolipoprotein diacylglyceryl transferase n=1 Tax=Paenibacillus sp. URB8-2 TaxID=2741301 RepID=UPI0015BCD881|nr:prolipoprotein diacylglyceryl transferase [Paenibacillus sp. URB8-2]BCG60387.1 prolipoprotein diacylglyceryl transferase [Paenibacillus sp. URB8-2]
MRVILFHIGDFPVRSYGLIVAIAILLSASVAYYLARGSAYQKHIFNMLTYVIIGAIVGARLWEVVFFQSEYYSKHLPEVFAIWNGGLSIQGGLVGGFIAGAIYTRMNKLSFWEFADLLAPAIVLGQAIGRIACFLNGDAYGTPTNSGFGLVYPKGSMAYDAYGSQPLWPAEIFEMQWDLIVFAILITLRNKKWTKGFHFMAYNILYSFGRFMLEFLRGDTPRYALDWTAAQWTSMAIITASIAFLVYAFSNRKWRERGIIT